MLVMIVFHGFIVVEQQCFPLLFTGAWNIEDMACTIGHHAAEDGVS